MNRTERLCVTNTLTARCHRILSVCSGLVVACVPLDQLHYFFSPVWCLSVLCAPLRSMQCRKRRGDPAACVSCTSVWMKFSSLYCVVPDVCFPLFCMRTFHIAHRWLRFGTIKRSLGKWLVFFLFYFTQHAHKRKMHSATCPSPCWWWENLHFIICGNRPFGNSLKINSDEEYLSQPPSRASAICSA